MHFPALQLFLVTGIGVPQVNGSPTHIYPRERAFGLFPTVKLGSKSPLRTKGGRHNYLEGTELPVATWDITLLPKVSAPPQPSNTVLLQ